MNPVRESYQGVSLENFLNLTQRTEIGCWEWRGHAAPSGYPHVWVYRAPDFEFKMAISARRVAAGLFGIDIPERRNVRAGCLNPRCVNPEHITLTCGSTHPGSPRGERHGRAKLTETHVRDIRARHDKGETQTALAREFGVSIASVHNIVTYKTWARSK